MKPTLLQRIHETIFVRKVFHWRTPLHAFYRWYLRSICGGSHHVGPYGPDGRYIVLMTDHQYHRYAALARYDDPGERLLLQVRKELFAEDD